MATGDFEGWPLLLNKIVAGDYLSFDQASSVMREILNGRATSAQLGALLAVLRSRGESVDEMAGFAAALLAEAVEVPVSDELRERAIDTCGTGGDRSQSINVSTTASFVVAAAGVPVCKHGNRAATSQSGAADVLEQLGANIDPGPAVVARCVEKTGFGFCLAPAFHPAGRFAMPTRRELGIPTVFNYLGPLITPGRVRRQVVGVSDARAAQSMLDVLAANGSRRAMVVYGNDGLDEITTTTSSTIYELRDGEKRRYEIDPRDFGISYSDRSDLVGGDPAYNAERTRRILGGEAHPQSDVVALNAAAGLIVGDYAETFAEGVKVAKDILASGSAAETLDAFIAASNE